MLVPLEAGREGDLLLIDHEYGSIGPASYDLANLFCEWTADYEGTEADRPNYDQFPSRSDRRAFLHAYLGGSSSPDSDAIDRLDGEIMGLLPLVHLHWGYWGIIKAEADGSAATFDYLSYAFYRLDQFLNPAPPKM